MGVWVDGHFDILLKPPQPLQGYFWFVESLPPLGGWVDGHFDILLKPPHLFTGLFCVFKDWSPDKASHFRKVFKDMLALPGFEKGNYGTHSLRVGRSMELLELGFWSKPSRNWDAGTPTVCTRTLSNPIFTNGIFAGSLESPNLSILAVPTLF